MASMGKTILIMCVVLISGCTVTLDNPFVKKQPKEMKLVRDRIAAYELLEREAELVNNITRLKAETAAVGKPAEGGPDSR